MFELSCVVYQATNDRTNAFVTITENLAHDMTSRAQQKLDEGEFLGSLHGGPVAVKDLDDVAKTPTVSGSLLFENQSITSG